MRAALLTIALVGGGCDQGLPSTDVVGPFTGAVHRFVVDDVTLPIGGAQQTAFGDDLDGDGIVDNQFGRALTLLDTAGDDLNAHALDIIAAGVLASSVEIRAHALDDDPR
ncbi:MAG: hypothetical protein NT062_17595 [Proteobacteria bacterium]|nr:hypothetical protein [Pseudomonadota bacterium]